LVDIGDWDGIDWDGDGYFGVPRPSPKDTFPARVSDDPWTAFAVAVERAKTGDIRFVPPLGEVMDGDADPFVEAQITQVLADAAPDAFIDEVERRLRAATELPGHLVFAFCEIVAWRGRLSDVPTLAQAYAAKEYLHDADDIAVCLSDMLDETTTMIATPRDLPSVDAYRDLVLGRQQELATQLGRADALVYRGGEYSVERLARLALLDARGARLDFDQRRRFEAATGINCSAFYKKKRLQHLRAAAMLEEFIQSQAYARYRPGQRYFFGHAIPPA
jgi:hypothetical protein